MRTCKEIEVRVGVTKNIGNYESLRLDYTGRAVIAAFEDEDAVIKELREELRDRVFADINTLLPGR